MRRPRPLNETIRQRMVSTRQRDTGVELELRGLLHRAGLRFRVHVAPIAGMRSRADVVFRRARVAVFVNGCFWHGCPDHATWPKNNAVWWRAKIEGNRERDQRVDDALVRAGWRVVRVWEHDDLAAIAGQVRDLVWSRAT